MSQRGSFGSTMTNGNGTKNSYAQYLVQPNGAPQTAKQQRRAGKEWLPYQGQRQLIIAIDLGTTYSGASYCILEPGKRPKIEDVRAWPGQPSHLSKIPSVVTYDTNKIPRFFGAEAEGSDAENALDEGGYQIRWWKLHLKPDHLHVIHMDGEESEDVNLDPLPSGISAEQVCAGFLAYMVRCIGTYIYSRLSNGHEILMTLGQNTSYIVTVPNGWEIAQQQLLRQACIAAQLVTPDRGDSIRFVTEAEASINFCAMNPAATGDWLDRSGQNLIVCDAGGGTIDISTYEVTNTYPAIEVRENGVSDCILGGSATVDHRAMLYLQERLKNTRWDNVEDLRGLRQAFASSIKETFMNAEQEQILLPIGSSSENDPSIRLRRGKLVFTGKEVAKFFEPSISATEQSIRRRVTNAQGAAVTVAMVGGFSESVYFRRELQNRLGNLVQLCKPDESTAKAVASGALVWVIDGVVGSRVSRHSFGIKCSTVYRATDPKHTSRTSKAYGGVDGVRHLPDAFGCILRKGESGKDDEEHVAPFVLTWVPSVPCTANIALYVYRGDDESPEFVDEPGFEQLATFTIDMQPFHSLLQRCKTADGKDFLRADVSLAMRLSATELSAQCIFRHGGSLYRGPVTVTATHN